MDNLTHSLIGAALGQAGLKRRTGLAMPTLVIAANLPDLDASCTVLGMVSLAMRRGLTHGPLAMLVLPALLAGAMIAFDRWQARRGTRPDGRLPVRAGWLLALAYIGCLSHPLFDWMNSYGVRLLEPFSSRWYYGDALFIVDPWLLTMLGAGIFLSLRRERAGRSGWARPAQAAILGASAYVLANLAISGWAASRAAGVAPVPQVVVAQPVPLAFWRREVLWRDGGRYGSVGFSLFDGREDRGSALPIGMDDPAIAARVRLRPDAQAFLFWSRMPVAEREGEAIILYDQRFKGAASLGRFTVRLEP